MVVKKVINEAVYKLVKAYKPLKIYLFGSYAWGKPNKDSDLDFFIIVDKFNDTKYSRAVSGHEVLSDLEMPKDIIVYTKEEFEQNSKHVSSLAYKIKKDGKLLYESH